MGIVDKKIVAFITYSLRRVVRYPKPIVEVEELFVQEEYRRKGIAEKLLDRALSFAKEKDSQYIFLGSSKERVDAHAVYKKNGFDEYAFHYRRKIV